MQRMIKLSLELKVEDVELHIESSINKLKHFISNLTKTGKNRDLKRASLLSYWIDTYTNYIKNENTFCSEDLPKYHRGDVLKVNFGYRVGNEIGGLHYAIVLDNNNSKKSGVITVVPLVSQKDGFKNSHYKHSLEVGLYQLASKKISQMHEENSALLLNAAKKLEEGLTLGDEECKKRDSIFQESNRLMIKYRKNIDRLDIWEKDTNKLKSGSVVDFGQIITISKQKIYEPTNTSDLLYNIRISGNDMDMIDQKLSLGYLKQKPKV